MDVALRGAAGLVTLALPLATAAWLTRRLRTGWRLVLIGAATFLLSQVLHLPFNGYLLNPMMSRLGLGMEGGPGWALAGAAGLLGLSAGVFEEVARWVVYRFWARTARSWREAVALGAGHGGVEALLVGVVALVTLVQLTALRGQDLAALVPAEQLALAEAQVRAYWEAPGWLFFLSAVERASAMIVQVSLAVIVLQSFLRRGGALWLLAAIGWHALINAVAVYIGVSLDVQSGSVAGTLATEAAIAMMALISLWALLRLRPPPEAGAGSPPLPAPHSGPLPPGRVSRGQVDSSRYTG